MNVKCWIESILYQLQCVPCVQLGQVSLYIGETSRTGFQRGGEHRSSGELIKDDFPLAKHGIDFHNLEPNQPVPRFRMTVLRSFKTALQRLVAQSVMIQRVKADGNLNSKSEWGAPGFRI